MMPSCSFYVCLKTEVGAQFHLSIAWDGSGAAHIRVGNQPSVLRIRAAWGELMVSHSATSMMSACSLLSVAASRPFWSTECVDGAWQQAARTACPFGRLESSFGLRSTWVAFCRGEFCISAPCCCTGKQRGGWCPRWLPIAATWMHCQAAGWHTSP